ncbi:MAG: biotin/lipoyl-containing protein, partial [Sphingobium phenoxybenzoativorans]
MPALSPTMEKGTLAKWLVERGDRISPGQLLAEIETDKATMELEAFHAGIITALLIAPGTEDVPVGTVIATLDTEADGDAAPVADDPPALSETQSRLQAPPAKSPPVPAVGVAYASEGSDSGIDVSPLAARLARAVGRDLAGAQGSGPAGRILKRDVIADAPTVPVPDPSDMSLAAPPHLAARAEVPHESVRLSAMRKVIAKRLAESKRTIPHFYLSINCRLDALLGLRGDLNRE